MQTRKRQLVINYLLVTLGCLCLAFGNAVFLVPNNLVTGGITSIAIIIQHFIDQSGSTFQAADIVTWGFQLLFLGVSFLFLGRQYTIRTLYASILYPLFFTLFYRVNVFNGQSLGVFLQNAMVDGGKEPLATLLLAAFFGGALNGLGVATSFAGGGTSGGIDVLAVLIAKVSRIKEATVTFIVDATLVVIGMIVLWDINLGLLGIVSAFMCAIIIQIVYINGNGFIIADIVSDKRDEIQEFVSTHLDRTTTVFSAEGGYSKANRTVIRVCLSKRQFAEFKIALSKIDPGAFVTFITATMIHGEGFDPLVTPDAKELIAKANESRHRKKEKK